MPRSKATKQTRLPPADGIGAFAGPAFDAEDITGHLKFWAIKGR
jgi:hypothetical protein